MRTVTVPSRPPHIGWLPLLGGLLWMGGAVGGWLVARQYKWSAGELVIAGSVWVLVLLVAARELVRDLFGPVFLYEVVRVGRRKSTFIFRWVYVLLIVALLGLLYFAWSESMVSRGYRGRVPREEMPKFANIFFEVVAVVQYVVVLLLTPGYVAATITSEKERQTLEFLLATDLRNREIVFGKLAARSITLGMYVLAGLPVLAFLQLFGGIDPDLALASAAGAVLTVFGLSAVSLAVSVAVRKSRDAIAMTYLGLVAYLAASLTLALLVRFQLTRTGDHLLDLGLIVIDWQAVADWFAAGNALYVYPIETNGGRNVPPDVIARMLGRYAAFWGVVTLLALVYAVARLRPVALAQAHGTPRVASERVAARRPAIGTQPVLWREVFGSGGRVGVMGWLFRFAVVGLVATVPCLIAYYSFFDTSSWRWNRTLDARWTEFVRGMSVWVRICTGVLTAVILFGAALRGAAAVAGERDKDTWLTLTSTPLTPAEVLLGKWVGCLAGMRFAYAVLLGVWGVGLALTAIHPLMLAATVLLIAVYVSAFSWVGIVCSLWAKTTLGASVRAFGMSLFLAGGFWLLFLVCCALPLSISGGGGGRTLEIPATLLLGGTPPFVAGWAPFMKFDHDGLGPFDSDRFDNGVATVAPVIGTVVWVSLSLLLAPLALRMLTKEMNRDPANPNPPRPIRRRAARADDE